MATADTDTIDTRTNIGGTDTIIGTITIEITIGTTTEINASRFSLGSQPSLL